MRNKGAIKLIDWYKREISPGLSPRCRHIPTCSEYAKGAILTYGSIKGVFLAMKRILKCRPGGSYGYDPVPKKEKL